METLFHKIKDDSKDPDLIERAFKFAENAHKGQKRFSGHDYIEHPLNTAFVLSQMKLDPKTIAAALLHDVVDDTKFSLEDIEKEFGKEIAFLVDGVTKLGKLRYSKDNVEVKPIEKRAKQPIDLQAENLRKMFFAMANDIRVVLIKLADRLHNMETIEYMPKEKQKRFALETLEVFVPLSDRLGIGEMKSKLQDLAFAVLYPKEYNWLKEKIFSEREEKKKSLEKYKPILKNFLEKEGIKPVDIQTRVKSYFSLYNKLLRYDMNLGVIYDLIALRIIVEDIKTCYETLGILHKHWRPLPGRIKDYIAFPKPNGYRSLHTTVFSEDGNIFEAQIRTREMHKEAEYGICAHWAMKQGVDLAFQEKKFRWVGQLRDWQKEIFDSKDFLEGLKIDFFKNRIFAFTPRGDVIDLPEGACPVDFAYAVHTAVGNQCAGAKINGKMAAVSTTLRNGDIVEVLLDKNKTPSRDWLRFVKTNLARSQIRKQTKSLLQNIRETISPGGIVKKLFNRKERLAGSGSEVLRPVVAVAGQTDISLSIAKCCNPKPGEKIKAYITQAKGASIHRENCEKLKKAKEKWPQKIILASWKNK